MRELIPSGPLRTMLLPPTYGKHITESTAFTVLSVEVWASGLVVNIHLASGEHEPSIALEDHFGTAYSLSSSASMGSRNLQVFTPSLPPGTRSLTVRLAADADAPPVVTFAVPLMAVPGSEPGQSPGRYIPPEQLQRPA